MSECEFTYELPEPFQEKLIKFLAQNGEEALAEQLKACQIECDDVGLAYYAGLSGDTWDKRALDFTVLGTSESIAVLKQQERNLKDRIRRFLRPGTSGFLPRHIDYIVDEDVFKIELPIEEEESFEVLSKDIHDALNKGEPSLVLDRLHTYSTKYLRRICQKHGVKISDGDHYYPLQNLMGSLTKQYEQNKTFQSAFCTQALKMSISAFDKYNAIRNDYSYAHDNDVLNDAEAEYVVEIVTATLRLISKIEE